MSEVFQNNPDACVLAAVAKLEAAGKFLQSEFFMARLMEGMRLTAIEVSSPWLDRKAAAAYAHCSPQEIDRAASAKIVPKHQRGGAPMFLKADIDEAITSGRWAPSGQRNAGPNKGEK